MKVVFILFTFDIKHISELEVLYATLNALTTKNSVKYLLNIE